MGKRRVWSLLEVSLTLLALSARGADWPQFMRSPEHTGDAADEALEMPLGLVAQVKLDDAVTTSPAVVAGRVYVIDQMGTAYCVDPQAGRVLWRAAPDGEKAMGSNTSSPCVARGRVYYGTTAGAFHVLDASDGKVINTLRLGSPVLGSPTLANDSVYFQTVEPVLYCLDLDGRERWRWNHYARYTTPIPEKLKSYHPRSYDRPHYGGGEVAVSGRRVVTAFGWDQVCLEDKGNDAALVWCNRAALGKDDGIPCAPSLAGGYVYTAWPGVDGAGSVVRFSLADGSLQKGDQRSDQWAVFGTPAVRGATVYWGRQVRGVAAYEYGKGTQWESFHWGNPRGFTPVITSPALTRDHCLFTTLDGELVAVSLSARGSDLSKLKPEPFRFKTPHGKVIGSSAAVSGGLVCFGCDDGFLYVLGPGGSLQPRQEKLTLNEPRSKATSATGKRYAWPSPYGSPANTNFVDDPGLRPPFRLRWAVHSFGCFKQPVSATEEDVVYVTLAGTVVCLEQETARIRWRCRLPLQRWANPGVLCAGGRVYVPRPRQSVKPSPEAGSFLFCLDGATGETLWQADIGMGGSSRAAPVVCDGMVAFGTRKEVGPLVEAWDAELGLPSPAGRGQGEGPGSGGTLLLRPLTPTLSRRERELPRAARTRASCTSPSGSAPGAGRRRATALAGKPSPSKRRPARCSGRPRSSTATARRRRPSATAAFISSTSATCCASPPPTASSSGETASACGSTAPPLLPTASRAGATPARPSGGAWRMARRNAPKGRASSSAVPEATPSPPGRGRG